MATDAVPGLARAVADFSAVTWSRPSEAAGVDLKTQDYSVPARPDQRIRVWWYNRVDVAGDLFGSRLHVI
jgi:hypothetical protein